MPGSIFNPVDDKYHYNPDKHIPDLSSKVIVVTGGNNGLGKATVVELAKHNPQRLYLTARSKSKYDIAMNDVRKAAPTAIVDFLELDLSSFDSVKRAADEVLASNDRLDILINNAGVMALPPEPTTKEGYEIHFGTNHMGHALLTKLLLPLLIKTSEAAGADVRIVNISSGAYKFAPKDMLLPDRLTTPMSDVHSYVRYARSKMANILYTNELARQFPRILSVSVAPGRVATALLDHMSTERSWTAWFQKMYDAVANPLTPEQGAYTQLWAATWQREDIQNGGLYVPFGKLSLGSKWSRDIETAKKLWEWQETEFQKHGYA